jgi:nicotinate-nucleotide adenylyltransferase
MGSSPAAGEARSAIGVLGSAFNPPHLGHLALAQEALWQLGLDEVVLVPTGEAPHKRIHDDPGRELRLAMTRLAASDDPRFTVSTLEVEREGPSYTYETLQLLARERGDPDLVFVMGADAAVGLESWREPRRVVELARLAVARRSGISDADVGSVMRSLDADGRATML